MARSASAARDGVLALAYGETVRVALAPVAAAETEIIVLTFGQIKLQTADALDADIVLLAVQKIRVTCD